MIHRARPTERRRRPRVARRLTLGVALLLVLAAAPLRLASPTSATTPAPASGSPPALTNPSMAFDPADNYTVLFGGIEGYPGTNSNETWIFAAGSWTELHPSVSPPATNGALFTYDAADGYLLLYEALVTIPGLEGGATWSFVHGEWTNRTPASGGYPRILGECSMAFDPADGYVVLFGIDYRDFLLNQTWEYSTGQWRNITSAVAPPGASQWLLQWDPETDSLIHLGGGSVATPILSGQPSCADVWTFVGGAWNRSSQDGPCGPGPGSTMSYDARDGQMVEYSGSSSQTCEGTPCNWTWTFNGSSWSGSALRPAPPLGLDSFAASAYDARDGEVVLFGGELLNASESGTVRSDQTWTYFDLAWHNETAPSTSAPSASGNLLVEEEAGVALGALIVGAALLVRYLRGRAGPPRPPRPG